MARLVHRSDLKRFVADDLAVKLLSLLPELFLLLSVEARAHRELHARLYISDVEPAKNASRTKVTLCAAALGAAQLVGLGHIVIMHHLER